MAVAGAVAFGLGGAVGGVLVFWLTVTSVGVATALALMLLPRLARSPASMGV